MTTSKFNKKSVLPLIGGGGQIGSNLPYLRASLADHLAEFRILCEEINSFGSITEAEMDALRTRLFDSWRKLQPDQLESETEKFVDEQLPYHAADRQRFIARFNRRFIIQAIPITVLSAALAEAVINSVVLVGLTVTDRHDLFAEFDKLDLVDKWKLGPRLFVSAPVIDPGTAEFGYLKKMKKLRNDILHGKPDVRYGVDPAIADHSSEYGFDMGQAGRSFLLQIPTTADKLFDQVFAGLDDWHLKSILDSSRFDFPAP